MANKDEFKMNMETSSKISTRPSVSIIDGVALNTNLRGDVKHEGLMDCARAEEFLSKLEVLLKEYEISKIDLCWAPSANTP